MNMVFVNENPGGSDLKRQQDSGMRTCLGREPLGGLETSAALASPQAGQRQSGKAGSGLCCGQGLRLCAPNAGARFHP